MNNHILKQNPRDAAGSLFEFMIRFVNSYNIWLELILDFRINLLVIK